MRVIDPIEMTDTVLTDSNVPEDDFAEWNVSTSYTTGQKVILLSTHRIYEALQATTGDDPATDDGLTWLDIGATNRWRAFDGSIEGSVTQAETIEYEFTLNKSLSGLALLSISAANLRVKITDLAEGVIDEINIVLVDTTEVIDWFTYFYGPITQTRDVIISEQPFFVGAVVEVELTGAGTLSLGELVIGEDRLLGTSVTGTTLGIEDFSTKSKDQFGRTFILERAFANTVGFEFTIPTTGAGRVRRILSDLRAKPAVYYTGPDQIALGGSVYGFPRDFRINLQTPVIAFATLEIEGLT
jgi:hypothetical protein